MAGETNVLFTLPEPIGDLQVSEWTTNVVLFLLVWGGSGAVYAAQLAESGIVQTLGEFGALPDWNDTYFTMISKDDFTDQPVVDRGPAERVGDRARVGNFHL